jgi:putative DNA primase/helicase
MSDLAYNTVERARGRWTEILLHVGIDHRFLSNKHGPCPMCGGKDRYRFDDRDGSGSFFCNQCGAGSGIILVRKFLKCDHGTACRRIDDIIGNGPGPELNTVRPQAEGESNRLAAIERLLAESADDTITSDYLRKRGLRSSSPILRGHRACPYYDTDSKFIGKFPAIIAPISGADGKLQSAVRIYDADLKPRKKNLPAVTTFSGGAVRLHDPRDGVLAISEGIETGLAVHEMHGLPVWATLSSGGISAFQPPAGLKALRIFGDNDSNFDGQASAYALAKRISRERPNIRLEVHIPPDADTDWLDVLNGGAA